MYNAIVTKSNSGATFVIDLRGQGKCYWPP